MAQAKEFFHVLEKPLPYKRFYIGKPSPIRSLTEMRTTKETVFFKWQDSDGGESDIHSYRIISVEGFWGSTIPSALWRYQSLPTEGVRQGKPTGTKSCP